MTVITLRNAVTGMQAVANSYAEVWAQTPPVVIGTSTEYNRETVTKVLAARRGPMTTVPADAADFREWLTT